MKQFILVLMLVIIASAETVKPATDTICACDKIKSESDCKNVPNCAWTAAVAATATTAAVPGSCGTPTTPPTPVAPPAHCPQVAEPATNCWKTLGCAYVDSKCTHFTGCTAYVKTTNSDCQAISKLCVTDGTQCTDAKSCNEYTLETQCTTNASISGILKCKWDNNACRDYVCTEADATLATNVACNAWLSGCVTTGKGCIATLGACASYIGDDVACSGLKGTDGNCEGTVGGTNCTARLCNKAAATVVTDSDCAAYQIGCITNGKGCVASPLPACATYPGDNTSCVGYIGSDGNCEGDAGATNCRARNCTGAPTSNNTDTLCNAYKTGCVTTGKGCVSSRGTCAGYSGTTTSCVGFIGSDGYCKGTNTTSSPCAAKVCTDALATTSTDAACNTSQIGCKSTGKGCVATLGPCSGYNGTTTTCEGYVGLDGKCKGVLADTAGPCTPKICTEAPSSTSTNEACAAYQPGCVTTGSGCVALTSCLNTIKSITCTGTNGCGWNNICVASQNCSDFLTISICNGNNAISGSTSTPCFWTGSQCRNLACTDAPNTHNTDSLCNTFLAGCYSKGNGCLAPTAPCSSYVGTRATCSAFTKKCWNTETAGATVACTERVCIDDITSTTDSACDSFKTGCRTKGTGCIEPTKLCSDYQGIQSACDLFKGNNGTTRCWGASATTSSNCQDKTCSDLATASTDTECDTFLSGCLYNGVKCVSKTSPCTSYTGTQSQCNNFKGTNQTKTCWNTNATTAGSCIEKNCGHAPNTNITDADCATFLTGCVTNGAGCISSTSPCSSYSGTLTQCAAFTGNSKRCYNKDSCADRQCADKTTAADNNECTTYLSSCRYFNGGCVNAGACNTYPGDSLAKCQDVLDNSGTPQKCWWVTAGTNCIARACSNAPTVTNQAGCANHLSTCVFNGSICLDSGTCASYTAFGTDTAAKQTNCGAMKNSSSKYCWNSGGGNCEDRSCANVPNPIGQSSCDTHMGDTTTSSCWWNGAACVLPNTCSNYSPTGANDAAKLAVCQAMKDNSGTPIQCYYSVGGSTCVSKSCANVPSPNSQTSCDNHVSGCSWNGTSCVAVGACITYTPAGADDTAKKIICKALKNSTTVATAQNCTYISGYNQCIERTCENADSPTNQTDCTNWLAKCQWNGAACEDKQTCATHIAFGADDAAKITVCKALTTSDTTAVPCGFTTIASSVCQTRLCSSKTDAANVSACTTHLASCRYVGALTCVDSKVDCAYTPTGADEAAKRTICDALTNTAGGNCSLLSGASVCSNRTCAGLLLPADQAACTTYLAGCKFLGSTVPCSDVNATCAYTPTGANEAAKRTICEALTNTAGGNCSLLSGASVCSNRTCAGLLLPADQAACTTYLAGCKFLGSTVPCSDVNATCAYTPTGAHDADKRLICEAADLGCQYLNNAATCSAKTCAGNSSPANVSDCTNWKSTCRLQGSACVDANATCNYTVSGADDSAKLALCVLLTNDTGAKCGHVAGATTCSVPTCSGKTAADQTACSAIQSYCYFIGTDNCGDAGATCAFTATGANDTAKKAYCELVKSTTGQKCSLVAGATNCSLYTCASKTDPANLGECTAIKSTCQFIASHPCVETNSACTYTVPSSVTAAADKRSYCQALTDGAATPSGCQLLADLDTACSAKTCQGKWEPADQAACTTWKAGCLYVGTTGGQCQESKTDCAYTPKGANEADNRTICEALKSTSGVPCTLLAGATVCSLTNTTCAYPKTSTSDCELVKNSLGVQCTYITGSSVCSTKQCQYKEDAADTAACISYLSTCEIASTGGAKCTARSCSNASPSSNNTDCTGYLATCRFNGNTCTDVSSTCAYTLAGTIASGTEGDKITFCQTLDNGANPAVKCTFVTSTNSASCILRTCANILPNPTSYDNCTNWLSTCTYNGTVCVNAQNCTNYTTPTGADDAAKATYCKAMKDTSGAFCGFVNGQSNCTDRACGNAPTPSSDSDCSGYLNTCTISNAATAVCILKTSACTSFTGLPNQCQSYIGNSFKCWSVSGASTSTPASCKVKECTDNTTATTNDECSTFLSGCKTSGAGCVLNNAVCSTFFGNSSTCVTFKASDGTALCKVGTSSSDPCNDKACSDDGSSTTDAQCNSFMSSCLTKGMGCIDSTEPCTKYQGTQSICQNFVGNGKKCWNPTSVTVATTYCVDKKCSDDDASTTDTACNASLTGCVTKGTGCIEKTAACGSYQGTQSVCSLFKGSNGTKLCWNTATATATTPCTEKACSDNTTATSDTDCDTFLPKASGAADPKCVTNGTGCVDYPRSCSQFTGTLEQCGKFKATDGPCKTTATGSISASGTCTPRICSEALNSNNTDALCKLFHPTCVTTGYGCATSVGCPSIQEKNSCAAKTGCSWVNNCRSINTDCSSLTTFGASICINTPVTSGSKKCSWYNGNTCRAQTCDDLPATLVSHDSCKAVISTCTTTGSGCITIGNCSAYATEVICKAAKTTQAGDTCIWDTNACRAKKCTDAPTGTTTDAGCDTYLTGCKTNGTTCVASVTCSTLLTASACQVDGNSRPCLFVNNQCYSYAKCEDAVMTTHSSCQQFSPLCTTSGDKCIAITSCANTVLQVSCIVGTDGACGWLPANGANAAKCQKFGACSDAVGADNASCGAYGTNCITDGTKCVDKSTCSTYLAQLSCDFGGTDGTCQFVTASNSCRLRECTDATATNASGGITSHSGCYGFTAKTKCTTNGTTCISLQACASYSVEPGCVEGTDGLCVYDFPVGQTTGTKACRVKACGDFKLATSAGCSVALTGAGLGAGCVSDGTNCIVKAACSSYTSKEACNGGGSDGICAFTPGSTTTPTVGTCKLMSACADANSDSMACNAFSSACNWQVSTSGATTTTTCNAHTCTTKATGSTCNPVPSFDGKSYTVCGPATTGGCTEVAGITLLGTTCQLNTLKTYTWDETTQKCTACFTASGTTTDPGTTTGGGTTTNDGKIIKSIATLVILAILVA